MESRWAFSILLIVSFVAAFPANERQREAKKTVTPSYPVQDDSSSSSSSSSSSFLDPNQAGYPELFTRKTARLLSEALHMLNRVKDVKERRWLESFVHRLASLAQELDHNEQLRVKGNKTAKDLVEFSKSLVENADQLKDFVVRVESERGASRKSAATAVKGQNEDDLVSQLRGQPQSEIVGGELDPDESSLTSLMGKQMIQNNKTPKLTKEEEHAVKMQEHRDAKLRLEKFKEAEKKKILKEIFALSQKLRDLGGETKTVLDVIKRSRGGVEIGTGHHFWEGAHPLGHESSPTLTPVGGQLKVAGSPLQTVKTTASAVTSNGDNSNEDDSEETLESSDDVRESNDDDVDLVKQLEEEKLLLMTTDSGN